MSETPIHKPSGWKGAKADAFWTKDSKYGCKYKCSKCGKEALGRGDSTHNHWASCPVRTAFEGAQRALAAVTAVEAAKAACDWRSAHAKGFTDALWACDDVQTLRALAHRLGYKEGT